jgi:seryl-tRNA synthetase
MLDIQFIRENAELVAEKSKLKGYEVDITQLLGFDEERRDLLQQVEDLRRQRNETAAQSKGGKPTDDQVKQGKQLKEKTTDLEHKLAAIDKELNILLEAVPNVIPDDTPEGGEENNREEKKWGEPRNDAVIDHLEWGEKRGLIDFENGAKVAGSKFYYLKGPLVQLELAVFQ